MASQRMRLRRSGVDHALVTVFGPETFGDLVGPIVFGDFFAHDADVFVALDLFVECLLNSFAVSDEWHGIKRS